MRLQLPPHFFGLLLSVYQNETVPNGFKSLGFLSGDKFGSTF